MINDAEREKDSQRQAEIDQGLDVLREHEEVLRDIYLRENAGVAQKSGHTLRRGLAEISIGQVTAEHIDRVVRCIAAEEAGKDQRHDQLGKQRRKHGPDHAEHGALIFFLKIMPFSLR